jgi:hypothetical protein
MPKFPVDAPKRKVIRALEELGFRVVNDRFQSDQHRVLINWLRDVGKGF